MDESNGSFSVIGESSPSTPSSGTSVGGSSTSCFTVTGGAGGRSSTRALGLGRASPLSSGKLCGKFEVPEKNLEKGKCFLQWLKKSRKAADQVMAE